jgi:single-stranded-DNA-specific exonuclease
MDGVRLRENWKIIEPKIKYDKYDTITDKILKIRGIKNKEKFINPSDDDINNPFLLSNMSEAVEKIINAINNNLKIGIYSDIDCDGVTSATIMYKYLKHYDINPMILYHQRNKNHGVIISNVPKDLDLLIIVDSSSNSAKECSVLSKNMDIIVLDHHNFERKNPYATIVNPQYNDYLNKFLSGAGVVYQTCKAIDEEMLQSYADNYIDICAVGLIGDVMNVTSPETRALIHKGLLKIHNNCDKNLLAILKSLKKEYKPNTTTIGFYLVPFINAIIRLGKIEDILEILTTDDEKRLKELIKSCSGMNDKRKTLQSDIAEEIDSIIDTSHKIIIVDVTELESPKTLNGLIANTVAQKYQKPTIVVSLDNDTKILNGSGRNYGNDFDFKEILSKTGLFESVGGHSGAFGVEFKPENLNPILEKVDSELEHLKQEYVIEADMIIDTKDITWDLLYEIQRLSFISGEGFKEPMFIIEGLSVGDVKTMKEVHLKFNAEDLECVKFNVTLDEIENVQNALCVDVLGTLSVNAWYNFGTKQNIKTKQVMIKDLEVY